MSGQTAEESLMAQRLVQALNLDHIKPEAIVPTAPLFGSSNEGIGLDSIDALEIALMIQLQRSYSSTAQVVSMNNQMFNDLISVLR